MGPSGKQAACGSSHVFSATQLFDLIYREETLFNVIKSVTRNGRSILLTALQLSKKQTNKGTMERKWAAPHRDQG